MITSRIFSNMRWLVLVLLALISIEVSADVCTAPGCRSKKTVYAFRKNHVCPATGKSKGACTGWVVDHIIPLCARGEDSTKNMQWQAKKPSLDKDKQERKLCRLRISGETVCKASIRLNLPIMQSYSCQLP